MTSLRVNVGDVLEIAGRLYDVVPDKQGGATLEPAITMTAAEILAAHGERALTSEEFEAYFGDLPSDGEGSPLLDPKGLAVTREASRDRGTRTHVRLVRQNEAMRASGCAPRR